MTDLAENRAFNWFAPSRFAILLGLLVFASFPQVLLGAQTFVARDYGFFAYPLAYFQKQCFWHGQLPFWDPYNNCGIPFLAQWNTMSLYPPSLIYLLLPLGWSLSFFCLLHFWFGGLGMYCLARRWTGNDFAGAFAGTAFSFSGMTLNLLMWPSHTAAWSWMPWVILAVERAWREGGGRIFIAAIAGAFQMLAGGPEPIFFTWVILLVLWVQQWVLKEFPRTAFWRFPALVALVALMAAAQLVPFLDLASHSQRHLGYADMRWSMPGRGWANFLVPMAFGGVHDEGIFFQNGQGWTSSYYLGMATLWLALLAVWKCRDRRARALAIIAAVGIICALGANTPIFPALRKLLPELDYVTYPIKYLLVVTFVAPLLAAFSLAKTGDQKRPAIVIGTLLLCLTVAVIIWSGLSRMPGADAHAAVLNGLSRIGFLVVTAAVLFALMGRFRAPYLRLAPLVLIIVAWLDVLTHEPAQNPTVPPGIYQPGLARAQLAMRPQPELGGSRAMVSPKAFMQFIHLALRDPEKNYLAKRLGYCANCNLLDGAPKVDGFFSLTPSENNGLISLIYGGTNDFPRLDDFIGVSQSTAPDEMYHWRARKTFLPLVTAGQRPYLMDDWNTLRLLTNGNFDGSKMVFIAPEDKPFLTVSNAAAARVLSSKFGTQTVAVDVDTPAPAMLVVAQTYYHDWRPSVDGQPVPLLRANYAFQAVEIPKGTHHVVLRYIDRAFEWGAVISIAAWVGCIAGWLTALILRRRAVAHDGM
ncbi:MAG: YfhO family protein [Limisphaerales bacterium]